MAGVDRDNDVPAPFVRFGGPLDGLRAAGPLQIDDETIAIGAVGLGREASRTYLGVQIQDDPELTVGAHAAADGAHETGACRQRSERIRQLAVLEVDDEAIRAAQRENRVTSRAAQVQYDTSLVTFRPYTDIFNRRARVSDEACRHQGYRCQQAHSEHHSCPVPIA